MTLLFSMLDYLGIERDRTRVEWVSAAEGAKVRGNNERALPKKLQSSDANQQTGGSEMQEITVKETMVKRAKELLADGTVTRVIGWKAGEFAYDSDSRSI